MNSIKLNPTDQTDKSSDIQIHFEHSEELKEFVDELMQRLRGTSKTQFEIAIKYMFLSLVSLHREVFAQAKIGNTYIVGILARSLVESYSNMHFLFKTKDTEQEKAASRFLDTVKSLSELALPHKKSRLSAKDLNWSQVSWKERIESASQDYEYYQLLSAYSHDGALADSWFGSDEIRETILKLILLRANGNITDGIEIVRKVIPGEEKEIQKYADLVAQMLETTKK